MTTIFAGCPAIAWGFIPSYLHEDDSRPAREQFDARYPGGWSPAPRGLEFDGEREVLTYPGDPPLKARGALLFRHETLLLFDFDWVVIVQRDGSWEASRLD
jgi:hypothetical protein